MTCAVIFDLDGTLLNTLDDLGESVNAVLAEEGFPEHPIASYKIFVGDGMRTLCERALPPAARDEATVQRVFGKMRKLYASRWDEKTLPYEGVPEMLSIFREKGVKAAILSNKPHDFTVRTVERFFPGYPFAEVFGERSHVGRKPDPAGALEIARTFGVSPAEVWYLGDSSTDMKTARSAGMKAVGALWGFRGADELKEYGAQWLMETPSAFVELVLGDGLSRPA